MVPNSFVIISQIGMIYILKLFLNKNLNNSEKLIIENETFFGELLNLQNSNFK